MPKKIFLMVFSVSHFRDEANALIWAICAGIIKPNSIWAKVNERACKILLAAVFWFPHCKQLGSVPAGRHKAGGVHMCWEPQGAAGAGSGFPILGKLARGSLHDCL